MTTLLIVYGVGVLINAMAAASIWKDLMEDKVLEKVRLAVLFFFVLASFGTWIYSIFYVLVKLIAAVFKRKKGKEDESDDGSGGN